MFFLCAAKEKEVNLWNWSRRWCFHNGGGAKYWSFSNYGSCCSL